MSEIAGRKVVKVADVEFTVKELSVAEVRVMLKGLDDQELDVVGDFLLQGVRLRDLQVMTSLTEHQVETFLPSQLEIVVQHCKEMNRTFFAMEDRLSKLREKR